MAGSNNHGPRNGKADGRPPLPAILREIADVVGHDNAIKIAAAVSGTSVYIPSRLTDDHWLVRCVGRPAADKIAAHFALTLAGEAASTGIRTVIPRAGGGTYGDLRRDIARQVQALDSEGKSSREIARIVGITQRSVHRHRRSSRDRRA